MSTSVRIHRTAEVSPTAIVGDGTQIWNEAQVRDGARIGMQCMLGKAVYIDVDVTIGDRVKLENRVSVFRGATIAGGVFVGPHTCLLNDKLPRAITPQGALKGLDDWTVSGVTVEQGASIGGGCTVLPGITIGRFALVGAGSVVTRDVPDFALVFGNPARQMGYVCECGGRLADDGRCTVCSRGHVITVREPVGVGS
jgi:acetyltransferase-like isoleucine patch superfamily enzyme